jgi:hypothetical protein
VNVDTDRNLILKARSVRDVRPVMAALAERLAALPQLQYMKIYPDRLAASNVLSSDGKKNPVVKVGAEGLVGAELLVDPEAKIVQFYALTSVVRGAGRQMVEAVLSATPDDWKVVVLMDWSNGFWARMAEDYPRLLVA